LRRALISAAVVVAGALGAAAPAIASNGVDHLHFAAGPYLVGPGANLILTDTRKVPKPNVNGFMVRVAPNLHYALANGKCCGGIPRVDVIHLHHGVWLSDGAAGQGEGNTLAGFYPFMASGEEKTIFAPLVPAVPGSEALSPSTISPFSSSRTSCASWMTLPERARNT